MLINLPESSRAVITILQNHCVRWRRKYCDSKREISKGTLSKILLRNLPRQRPILPAGGKI
jgi:hypothetical protein